MATLHPLIITHLLVRELAEIEKNVALHSLAIALPIIVFPDMQLKTNFLVTIGNNLFLEDRTKVILSAAHEAQ